MLSFFKSFTSQIHSQYSVANKESFKVGPWAVYDAKSRQTKEPVSVFVLDKSALKEKLAASGVRSKTATAEIYEFAQKGVANLAKLRHPCILRLVEPMETARGALMFVTERVTDSLSRLIKQRATDSELEDDLNELVIVRGAGQLVDGLRFLHDQLGYVHLNVSPTSVLVDSNGDWKLSGLEFLEQFAEHTGDFFFAQTDPRLPSYLNPNPDFSAPEVMLDHRLSPASDTFSLACLLYAVYQGKPPLDCRGNSSNYKEEYARLNRKLLQANFPDQLSPLISQLFERQPVERIPLASFADSNYFNNSLIKALAFLDNFDTKQTSEKVSFLKHFNTVVPQFPKSILHRKVLKFAITELKGPRDASTGELLSELVFAIAQRGMSRLTFTEKILPLFATLADYTPFHEALVANIEVAVKCTSDKDFTKEALPVLLQIIKASDAAHATTQRKLLTDSSLYVSHITVSGLEQKLVPAVADLFAATPAKSVKIASTIAFSAVVKQGLSKTVIQDRVIPTLLAMKTRDPAVVVAVADFLGDLAPKLPKNVIVEKELPFLLDLAMSQQLTVPQFQKLFGSVRSQLDHLESLHIDSIRGNKEITDDSTGFSDTGKQSEVSDIFDSVTAGGAAQNKPLQPFQATPAATSPTTNSPFVAPRGTFSMAKPHPPAAPAAKPTSFLAMQPQSLSSPMSSPPPSLASQSPNPAQSLNLSSLYAQSAATKPVQPATKSQAFSFEPLMPSKEPQSDWGDFSGVSSKPTPAPAPKAPLGTQDKYASLL